jgi:membrane protein GlpM
MALTLKALIGALMVILMALLAKSKNYYIAGLVPLFPTFALIAHAIVGTQRSSEDLKTTALFGIFSIIPYFAYLLSVYIFADKYALWINLILSTLIWIVFAGMLILIWKRFIVGI